MRMRMQISLKLYLIPFGDSGDISAQLEPGGDSIINPQVVKSEWPMRAAGAAVEA